MKWKTKDGIEMDVKHMDPIHAQNVINMIIKNSSPNIVLDAILYGVKQAKKKVADKAFVVNGEMAQDHEMDYVIWKASGEDPEENYLDDPYGVDPYWMHP